MITIGGVKSRHRYLEVGFNLGKNFLSHKNAENIVLKPPNPQITAPMQTSKQRSHNKEIKLKNINNSKLCSFFHITSPEVIGKIRPTENKQPWIKKISLTPNYSAIMKYCFGKYNLKDLGGNCSKIIKITKQLNKKQRALLDIVLKTVLKPNKSRLSLKLCF
jgi:hypothetical protein